MRRLTITGRRPRSFQSSEDQLDLLAYRIIQQEVTKITSIVDLAVAPGFHLAWSAPIAVHFAAVEQLTGSATEHPGACDITVACWSEIGGPTEEEPCTLSVQGSRVPEDGVEPSRGCPHGILSPARLPVPPLGL